MRTLRKLPRTFLPFVLASVFGPFLVMVEQGDAIHPRSGGLVILGLLLLFLARGSAFAWTLLLLWNLFISLSVVAAVGGGGILLWSGPALLVLGVASCALLLSPSMRQHVGVGRARTQTLM